MGLAVVAACGACAGLFQFITVMVNRDSWEDLGQPVPPVDPVVLPTPTWDAPGLIADDPDPVASIRHELETRVLATAVLDAPVESACDQPDYDGLRPASLTCTVTYEGLDVVFDISARPTSDYFFEWEGIPREMVVTREGILAQFWSVHGPDGFGHTDLRCDDGLPELALVPANQPLPQYCYARVEGQNKTARYEIVPRANEITAELSFNPEFQD